MSADYCGDCRSYHGEKTPCAAWLQDAAGHAICKACRRPSTDPRSGGYLDWTTGLCRTCAESPETTPAHRFQVGDYVLCFGESTGQVAHLAHLIHGHDEFLWHATALVGPSEFSFADSDPRLVHAGPCVNCGAEAKAHYLRSTLFCAAMDDRAKYVPDNLCGGCGARVETGAFLPNGWTRFPARMRCGECALKETPRAEPTTALDDALERIAVLENLAPEGAVLPCPLCHATFATQEAADRHRSTWARTSACPPRIGRIARARAWVNRHPWLCAHVAAQAVLAACFSSLMRLGHGSLSSMFADLVEALR